MAAGWSLLGIWAALVAQSVERVLGKDEVTGSNPVKGSSFEDNININL